MHTKYIDEHYKNNYTSFDFTPMTSEKTNFNYIYI